MRELPKPTDSGAIGLLTEQQGVEGDAPDAQGALRQERPAGLLKVEFVRDIHISSG